MEGEGLRAADIRAAMRDEGNLAQYTGISLGICATTNVVATGINVVVPEEPEGVMALLAVAGLSPALALLASLAAAAVFFIRWLRRCYADVAYLEGKRMPFTRSQLLWAWFIPILNLFRPLAAVRRLAAVSRPDDLPDAPGASQSWDETIPTDRWWAAWIIGGFLERVSARTQNTTLDIVSMVVTVVAAALCYQVVTRIDALRQERLRRLLAQTLAAEHPGSAWPTPAASPGEPEESPANA